MSQYALSGAVALLNQIEGQEVNGLSQQPRHIVDELARRQPLIWKSAFHRVLSGLSKQELGSETLGQINELIDWVFDMNPTSIAFDDDVSSIKSVLPLLGPNDVENIHKLAGDSAWLALAVLLRLIMPAFAAGALKPKIDRLNTLFADARCVVASADLAAAVQIDERAANHESAMVQRVENLHQAVTSTLPKLDDQMVAVQAAAATVQGRLDSFAADAETKLAAAKQQVTETEIFRSAVSLWERKASAHRKAYRGWLLSLFACVVGIIVIVVYKGPEIYPVLPKAKESNDVTYLVLAACVASVIGIGWLLRFFGRFVTENMIMHHDAQQRAVMLQVYLHLVGDPSSKIEQTDRTLIFSAIFRALPGHQVEDVAPPTLADLIKSAASPKP